MERSKVPFSDLCMAEVTGAWPKEATFASNRLSVAGIPMSLAAPGCRGIHQELGRRSMPAKKMTREKPEALRLAASNHQLVYILYSQSSRSTIEAGEASHFPVKIAGGDCREAFDISICM